MKHFRFELAFVAVISFFLFSDSVVFAGSADVASLVRILQARANNFSALKGKPLQNNGHHQRWEGMERPFGLWCEVNHSDDQHAYIYNCDACPDDQHCLSAGAIQNFLSTFETAARLAAPSFTWRREEFGGSGRSYGLAGGPSATETVVYGNLGQAFPRASGFEVCTNPHVCENFVID